MTIDDELLLEIIKPNLNGEIGKDALIRRIVGRDIIWYRLEHFEDYPITLGTGRSTSYEIVKITPDIVVRTKAPTLVNTHGGPTMVSPEEIAFEIENDLHWDFQESLRQTKKYKKKYHDTRIIIPTIYQRFVPLYVNEGIRVYLWSAKRKWECLRCGTENIKEGIVPPRCSKGDNNSPNDFRLIGLKDVIIKEFVPPTS